MKMSLTANQERQQMDDEKMRWQVEDVTGGRVLEQLNSVKAHEQFIPMTESLQATLRPMEVETLF